MSKANFESVVIEDVLKAESITSTSTFMTNEGIEVKSVYTQEDIQDVKHIQDVLWYRTKYTRTIPNDVCGTSLDCSSIRGFLHSRRIKCLLPS